MLNPGPDDDILELFLARFLSLMAPPDTPFTKELPANVESNPFVISIAMAILTDMGFVHNESIPSELNELVHRTMAIDFISALKVVRPDFIDHCLQARLPKPSTAQTQAHHTHLEQSTTKTQFHHYIPRFILKTFADNFSLDNSEYTTDTSSPDLSWFKPGKPSKRRLIERPKVTPRYDINVYRVEDHTTNPTDVSRAYGVENLYRDVTEADCMKFEKLLSKHESDSAKFIREIWNEDKDLSLTRTRLEDLKKFLVVMMYRSELRRGHYFNQRFELEYEISVKRHMDHNNISNVQTVWFDNLKWIIETSIEDIMEEYRKAFMARAKSDRPTAILSPYRGPIHAAELEEMGYLMTQTNAYIWQAETGSEFILSEGCFGAWEGDSGAWIHNFFVVSPRFAIVLVKLFYLDDRLKKRPRRASWFGDELHDIPDIVYKKGRPSKDTDPATHWSPDDVFKFKRIIVPKEDIYKVNAILLDDRREFLTYKSDVSMYKSLRYYDKIKKGMFPNCYDYSTLKGQLFSDLNRTHPVVQ
ncbi:hypothetical protein K457DRAFT_124722 [Linnemannia elongata AG-77]|uniref:Uncharacterized protein n=1 Tax=Linnemannia elongata AG-77 TaxID=1314771 RepID=A0A197K1D4_9FUNG|nr:hypothetical protein K457DRAFT_124722 [Linnemannia elongata AG-77]